MPSRAPLARRVGFVVAVVASIAAFGSSLSGIARVDGDLQRVERAPVIATDEVSDRQPAFPMLEPSGAERGQGPADCDSRDHRVDPHQAES